MDNNKWKEFIRPGSNLRKKNSQASKIDDLIVVNFPNFDVGTAKCVKKSEYGSYLAVKKKKIKTDVEKDFIDKLENDVNLEDYYCTDVVCIREFRRTETGTCQWNDLYALKAGSIIEITTSEKSIVEYEVYPYGSDYYHIHAGRNDGYQIYHIDEFAEMLERNGCTVTAAHDPEE